MTDICDTCAARNVVNGTIRPHATVFKTNDVRWHQGWCDVCHSGPVDIVSRPDVELWKLEKPTKDLTEPKP